MIRFLIVVFSVSACGNAPLRDGDYSVQVDPSDRIRNTERWELVGTDNGIEVIAPIYIDRSEKWPATLTVADGVYRSEFTYVNPAGFVMVISTDIIPGYDGESFEGVSDWKCASMRLCSEPKSITGTWVKDVQK